MGKLFLFIALLFSASFSHASGIDSTMQSIQTTNNSKARMLAQRMSFEILHRDNTRLDIITPKRHRGFLGVGAVMGERKARYVALVLYNEGQKNSVDAHVSRWQMTFQEAEIIAEYIRRKYSTDTFDIEVKKQGSEFVAIFIKPRGLNVDIQDVNRKSTFDILF